ncbi:MAG: tungsten formylmethanofuran dehydrogenase [Methylovirgula sp.]
MKVLVDGAAAPLEAAAAEAARLLEQAHMPLIAGLGTDVEGTRAAIALAEKLRGAYDHMHSEFLLRDIDVMRQAGQFVTTPNEARVRADCVVLIGAKLTAAWPDMVARLDLANPARFDDEHKPRKIFWLGPGRGEAAAAGATEIAAASSELPTLLSALRAGVAGHKRQPDAAIERKLADVAAELKAARFGVVIWSGESVGRLTIEMIYGLLLDLNKTTRFTGLPVSPGANAMGVAQTSGWMTGFPMRTGFGRGYPEHDTWRFEANRMVEAGEADAALWISAYGNEAPRWKRQVPFIAITTPDTRFAYPPKVRIDVGTPGIDHDAVVYAQNLGTLAAIDAENASDALQVAAVIRLIDQSLNENLTKGEGAC